MNAASRMPLSLEGGALARGGAFRIQGPRLAVDGANPGDVSVRIRQGEVQRTAAVLQAGAESVEAILPADAPLGEAELTVTFRNQTSTPFRVRIAAASPGIYTRNGLGWGPADTSRSGPFRPGQMVEVRVTGLGVPPSRVKVTVGGLRSPRTAVTAGGVRFQVPGRSPEGCHVPVIIRPEGGAVSNSATIPVARAGDPCAVPTSDPVREFVALTRVSADVRIGANPHFEFVSDGAIASFRRVVEAAIDPWDALPPRGSCTTFSQKVALGNLSRPGLGLQRGQGLDAGSAIQIYGPSGERTLARGREDKTIYSAILGGNAPSLLSPPSPLFLSPGPYTVIAPGSDAMRARSIQVTVPAHIESTNRQAIDEVERAQGVRLTWRGGGGDVFVVAVNVDVPSGAIGLCVCAAPDGAGEFTIPPLMLANLPVTDPKASGLPLSLLGVVAVKRPGAMVISASVKSVMFR